MNEIVITLLLLTVGKSKTTVNCTNVGRIKTTSCVIDFRMPCKITALCIYGNVLFYQRE